MRNFKSLSFRLVALLLSLLLLWGCGVPGADEDSPTFTRGSSLTENTAPVTAGDSPATAPTVSNTQQPEAKFYPADLTPNVTLPEYDPERVVYFTCHGWDYDFYPNSSHCDIRFYILTKDEFALEDIQISLPLESAYTAEPYLEPLFHKPEKPEDTYLIYGGMPYYVYQTYQGVDWAEFADLWLAAEKAKLEIESKWPIQLSSPCRHDPRQIRLGNRRHCI